MEIKETTKQELFEILYTIEDIEYKTELGKRVSKLLTELEKQCTKEEYELEKLKEELEWWRTYGEYVNANYSGVCAESSAYADGDVD